MGRQIISTADSDRRPGLAIGKERGGSATPSRSTLPPPDTYADRVLKYIPAEVVALYLAVSNMIKSAGSEQNQHLTLWWIIIVGLLIATPVYLHRVAHVTSRTQMAVSTIAFAMWVFALDSPIDYVVADHASLSLYKAVILPIFTFLVGLLIPRGDSFKFADAIGRNANNKDR
jgi:hypothetical protein